ncbi:MAG: response regulator [Fibrobacterales bacterium]
MSDKKYSVLIIDDTPENIDILIESLQDTYALYVATQGKEGIQIALTNLPDIILLDIMMPDIDGYEVCKTLKANPSTQSIPIIFLTALTDVEHACKGLEIGAADFISKPFDHDLLSARISTHLALKSHRDKLELLIKERTLGLELTQRVLIESLGTIAEYRDPETGGHIKRTQNYIKALAKKLNTHPKYSNHLSDSYIDILHTSAPLHDIGKVGIADTILLKPGKLTPDEFNTMKEHAQYGYDILKKIGNKLKNKEVLKVAQDLAFYHHEKWDGSGYPQQLKGEEIPLAGRLMAIADVYDALISKRVYKEPFGQDKAVAIIKEGSGSHFDPDIVTCFCEIQDTFRNIAITYADFDEEIVSLGGAIEPVHKAPKKINRILIADDNDINIEIMKNQLEALNFEVLCAQDGASAYDLYKEKKPEFVFTDLGMPNGNGYMVTEQIREYDSETPIYLLTASDYNISLEDLKQKGFNGFLLKPLDEELLIKILGVEAHH